MAPDLETVRALYRRLLTLYPRAFREQLGASMEQTFADLCTERRRTQHGWPGFLLRVFADTALGIVKEHARHLRKGNAMKPAFTSPTPAAILGFLLALPFTLMLVVAWTGIEPFNSFLESLVTHPDGIGNTPLGLAILVGSFLLLPAAFLVSVLPVRRMMYAGGRLRAYPVNLVLAFAILTFFLWIVGSLIADQYPCWMGVPNCD